jgi:hypothetical protein
MNDEQFCRFVVYIKVMQFGDDHESALDFATNVKLVVHSIDFFIVIDESCWLYTKQGDFSHVCQEIPRALVDQIIGGE